MVSRPVLIAPDKFKGTFSAKQVAEAIARGLARIGAEADICRIADGGEGTLAALRETEDSRLVEVPVSDALGGAATGRVLLLDDGRSAIVEVADAIGLARIAKNKRDPVAASSRGAGELIVAACRMDVRDVFVGVGGTATTDGGAGAIDALREAKLIGTRGRLKGTPRITALCDVRAAWDQAAAVFAPQKGANDHQVRKLAKRLELFATELPSDPRGKLFTGAGGGLSGGLWAATGAELRGGGAFVLDRLGFTPRMIAARAVITGEGSLDRQTLLGKAVGEVATRARQSGVPCHAIVGQMSMTEFDARVLDFESVREAGDLDAIADAAAQLEIALAPA